MSFVGCWWILQDSSGFDMDFDKLFVDFGEARLREFCKMHFKTAYEAMGKEPPVKKAWNPGWKN